MSACGVLLTDGSTCVRSPAGHKGDHENADCVSLEAVTDVILSGPGSRGARNYLRDAGEIPPWPWREMGVLADQLYAALTEGVKALMTEAGEDPGNVTLFRLRCVQVAYSVKANAERAWDGRAT